MTFTAWDSPWVARQMADAMLGPAPAVPIKPRLCAAVIRSWLTSLNGAMRFAREHSTMTAIYCRITGESNGIYPANAPWFTWAISDEQETKPLVDVGKNWTCVQMVRPNA